MPDTEGSPTLRQSAPSDVYHELLEHAADAIWVHDLRGRLTYVNRATESLFGQPRESLLGSDVFELAHALQMHTSALRDEVVVEFDLNRRSGETTPVEASLRLLRVDGQPAAVQVIARDVRGRKEQVEVMRRRAFHDPLTDMPNRALLNDRLTQAMRLSVRHRRPFAILLVDLDGFKAVNDTHGHQVGDDVLREVANRFKQILRTSDTCARFGGDEFVMLLPETDVEGAKMVARKVQEALAPPIRLHDLTLAVGASIGIAVYPDHADPARPFDVRVLLSRADAAMYAAKRSGRSAAIFGSEAPQARRRLRAVTALDIARRRARATSAAALAAAVLAAMVVIPGSPSQEDNPQVRSIPLWQGAPDAHEPAQGSLLDAVSEANGGSHFVRAASFRVPSGSTAPGGLSTPFQSTHVLSAEPTRSGGERKTLTAPPAIKRPSSPPQGGTAAPAPGHGSAPPPPSSKSPTSSPAKGNGNASRQPAPPAKGGSSSFSSPGGSHSDGGSHAGTGKRSDPSGSTGSGGSGHQGGRSEGGHGSSNTGHGSSNAGNGSSNAGHGSPKSGHGGPGSSPPSHASPPAHGSSNAGTGSSGHGSSNGRGNGPGSGQGQGQTSGRPSHAGPKASAGGGPPSTGPGHGGGSASSSSGNGAGSGNPSGNGRR